MKMNTHHLKKKLVSKSRINAEAERRGDAEEN